MATTQIALALIATTLLVLALLTWATIRYVPAILYGDDGDAGADAGRPS